MTKEKLKELQLLTEEKLAVSNLKAEIYRWVARQEKDVELEDVAWAENGTAFDEWHEAAKAYRKAEEDYWKEISA
jgi:hypothetical protein